MIDVSGYFGSLCQVNLKSSSFIAISFIAIIFLLKVISVNTVVLSDRKSDH